MPPIRLRYVRPPRWLRAVCSPVDPVMQIREQALEIGLVVLPCHAVHPRRGVPLQRIKRLPELGDADMVQKRW